MTATRSAPGERSLADDQALLGDVLAEVLRLAGGDDAVGLHRRTVDLARAARGGDGAAPGELAGLVAGLEPAEAGMLVRSLTRWFQLVNLAEDNQRVRALRARDRREAPAPRPGSLRDAVSRLARDGTGPEDLAALLERAEIRLVLTAHPTESRRRTTLEKLARVFAVLRDLDERPTRPEAERDARRRLLATVQELWGSEELRAASPTVLDEVRAGLVYFISTLGDTVPAFYRDLEAAVAEAYPGADIPVPPLLTFGSWIGGDRDGNPYVTPEVTLEALDLMRDACLRRHEDRLGMLAGRLSFSERLGAGEGALRPILDDGAERFPVLAADLAVLNREEPYRRALTFLRERVRAARRGAPEGYGSPGELLADLLLVEDGLRAGPGALTAGGDLRDVIRQVEVFGFHFARLDVREHAGRHRQTLDEVLARVGVQDGYAALPADARADLLAREIADPRPLVPADPAGLSEDARTTLRTFRAIREALAGRHRGAIEAYVISHTEAPADLLEVLLLMKESGLAEPGGSGAALRIVPLLEAGATLDAAPATMDAVLRRPEYRAAVRAAGDEQEVMVGYSDSNKDVGYVASGWATYSAQTRLAEVFDRHGVSWTFFHGRGGAVGRGGGPTNTAILALPPGTVGGRLKMTEQGEVLAAKYAVREIAHRELELTASAVLVSTMTDGGPQPGRRAAYEQVLEGMAARSAAAYRALVHDDPDFAAFFQAVTPVDEISRLQLGSRPAKRSPSGGIDDLRAIPWVFSWTQARIVLPAWYGLGTALAWARDEVGLDLVREMEAEWPFFSALLANAEMACAKADPGIARRYIELWDDAEPRDRIAGALAGEFARTCEELVLARGEARLLDREPVLQASIDRRNPSVDPLSYVQVELLRRLRREGEAADDDLRRLSLLTVNGIAGGLRNTG